MNVTGKLDRVEQWLSNLCLAALVVVLALQVFFRYALAIGLSWSEEVSRFLFIWFVYVSASLAVRAGTHVRVTAFVDMLPPAAGRLVRMLADLVWIAFNGIVVVSGTMLFARMLQHPVYSTSLLLPVSWIYLVIPVAHAVAILRILQRFARWDGHDAAGPVRDDNA